MNEDERLGRSDDELEQKVLERIAFDTKVTCCVNTRGIVCL